MQEPDTTPPNCTIVNTEGICSLTKEGLAPCDEEFWSFAFITQDSDVGLVVVKPISMPSGANFTVDSFISGSNEVVNGSYTSDCCEPRVSIVASDKLGNAGYCNLEHIPITTTAAPTTPSDSNAAPPVLAPANSLVLVMFSILLLNGAMVQKLNFFIP